MYIVIIVICKLWRVIYNDKKETKVSEHFLLSYFLYRSLFYILQTPQEVTLELTDDTWPRRDENSQTVATKHHSSRYIFIQVKIMFSVGFHILKYYELELLPVLQSSSCTTAAFRCSLLTSCSSCVTNSQSEREKYCFFHTTQFT